MSGATIRSAEVLITSPSRNFVTLRVVTEDGVVGLGDATLNGRELAVASYLQDHVAPLLVGRDSQRIEDTWQFLHRGAYWRRGPVTMSAIGAVDMALWDIKSRRAGMPLYQLLGGASRDRIRAYAHASGRDIPSLLESIHRYVDAGFTAVRVQVAIPGVDAVYGVSRKASTDGRYNYEPASRTDLPLLEDWDSRAYLTHLPPVFEAVRAEFGPELILLHDAHHRLRPIEAARLGKSLEPYDLFWLEDCTPADNQESLRLVRRHTTTPLAIGEVLTSMADYQLLIQEQLIDYVRSSLTHTGGVTGMKRLLEFAAQYQIRSGIHNPTDISPVGMSAALHLDLAIHNFGIQEYMPHAEVVHEVFQPSYRLDGGHLHPGDEPGLGVTYDDREAAVHSYQRAYLPYARLADGTLHEW